MSPSDFRTNIPQKLTEASLVLLMGGVLYYTAELLWRGRSHWSMALCGGLCFWMLYRINRLYPDLPFLFRAISWAAAVTAVELIAGCLLNLGFGLAIRDYSRMPMQLLGQICLPFSLLWFLLAYPASWICRLIRCAIFLADE